MKDTKNSMNRNESHSKTEVREPSGFKSKKPSLGGRPKRSQNKSPDRHDMLDEVMPKNSDILMF
jgi:hypothetical protein